MARLCIIPARSGSKRIPKKAIKEFHGKPIMSYSIEAANRSKLFDEIMVSTDSEKFAEIARFYGAKTPFLRSAENSSDHATTLDAIKEVVEYYASLGKNFDEICCLYPAAPLITAEHLLEAHAELKKGFSSVFAAVKYGHPIQRAFKLENGKASMFSPEHQNTRSQDLESTFHDAGQFYFLNTEEMLSQNKIFTNNCTFIGLSEMETQDIDNDSDWQLAELKYKLLFG